MLSIFQPLAGLLNHHTLYAVGGAVRAHLQGQGGVEADFATPSLPNAIMATATQLSLPVMATGLAWGSIQVAGCDITTFRTEAYTPGSRYPQVTFVQNLAQDAIRRDFTCNAIYLAADGALTDPFGGAADWHNGQVVWVGNPAQRLAEDPLRWWRWLRFCAEAGANALEQPRWLNLTNGQRQEITLQELAALAATQLPHLSASRLLKERQKFGAQPYAGLVQEKLSALLALHSNLPQELKP